MLHCLSGGVSKNLHNYTDQFSIAASWGFLSSLSKLMVGALLYLLDCCISVLTVSPLLAALALWEHPLWPFWYFCLRSTCGYHRCSSLLGLLCCHFAQHFGFCCFAFAGCLNLQFCALQLSVVFDTGQRCLCSLGDVHLLV